jgi:hypothetical protein
MEGARRPGARGARARTRLRERARRGRERAPPLAGERAPPLGVSALGPLRGGACDGGVSGGAAHRNVVVAATRRLGNLLSKAWEGVRRGAWGF